MAHAQPYPDNLTSIFAIEAGQLIWRDRPCDKSWSAKHAGKPVRCYTTEKGYIRIYLNRRPLLVHRVVWKMNYGTDPICIDHINGDRSDNRIENLRACDHSGNARNTRPRQSRSRFKGVYAAKNGRWGSRIKVDGTTMHLGTYDSEEDAANAYDQAAIMHHGHFASTNKMLGFL